MGNLESPASLRALCQAVLTLRMCALGRCGLKKTYSDIPIVAARHRWSSALTNSAIGKVRRPAAVLDCATVIIDSSKSISAHLSLRASIPTRIPVSIRVTTLVRRSDVAAHQDSLFFGEGDCPWRFAARVAADTRRSPAARSIARSPMRS
jgi:hypothetical protein